MSGPLDSSDQASSVSASMECKYYMQITGNDIYMPYRIYGNKPYWSLGKQCALLVLDLSVFALAFRCVVSGYTIPSSGLRIDFEDPPNSNLIATVVPSHITEQGLIELNNINVCILYDYKYIYIKDNHDENTCTL